jgi:hypothetical protein
MPGIDSLEAAELIAELHDMDVSVDFTDTPCYLLFDQAREDGFVPANAALLTVTHTGRVFVEIFECPDAVRMHVLKNVAEQAFDALAKSERHRWLQPLLSPKIVLDMREWFEFRVSVGAA